MGTTRQLVLGVAGVVLAACGATLIVLAVSAQASQQPPPSAPSERLVSVVSSVETVPAPKPPPIEDDSLRPGPGIPVPPVTEGGNDPVLLSSLEPVAIAIPAIGVHSEMQQVGLTAEHTLEVPAPGPHYNQPAWYKHSATPGAVGPAIIVGHVDSATDGPSVFFRLGALRPGDEVLVTRRDGTIVIFTVEAVRQFSKDDFPTQIVYGDTKQAALRLITCGGTFDRAKQSYLDNVVVFATLAGSHQGSRSP